MITATLTADIVTGLTWNGGTNRSDAWASQVQDGGELTHYLHDPVTESEKTCLASVSGPVKVHMGTWITPLAPEVLEIKSGSSFNFNSLCGYESAGTLNSYVYYKISVVSESGGVLTYNRTIIDWTPIQTGGVNLEFGSNIASDQPMGGALGAGAGMANPVYVGPADTIATTERLALEIGIDVTASKSGTVAIEHGNHSNHPDVYTSLVGLPGGGRFGSEIGIPVHFTQEYPDGWGGHQELTIPIVAGTDVIPWADVGTDWSAAKWETTGATRIVQRLAGIVINQVWCFQDDDYLYLAMNNPTDGCIQASDHAEMFICAGTNWQGASIPDQDDWTFRRDITSGTSATRAPTLPVAQGDGNDAGEYILQGNNGPGYPAGLEIPTYDGGAKTFTFASNSKVFTEGVDFRMGGPGATATAPNPDGSSTGAYSEFKIKKSSLNNWTGLTAAGIMLVSQCDVQGNGTTLYPEILGRRIDKNDWPWAGAIYTTADGATASSKTTADPMDLRPWNAMHAHAPDLGVSFNASASATVDTTEAAISNQNAFQASASTTVDSTEAAISNANAFEATASATAESSEAAVNFLQAFNASTNATVDTTEAAISNSNTFSTNVSQFDELDTLESGWTQDSFDTYTASGAVQANAYDTTVPSVTDESYYTVYEILSSNNLGTLEFSAGGGTPVVAPSVAVGVHVVRGIIGGALNFVGQEMYFDGTWNGQVKIHSYGLDANFGLDSTIESSEAALTTAGQVDFNVSTNATVESTEATLATAGEIDFNVSTSATVESTEAVLTTIAQIDFSVSTNTTVETTEAVVVNENAFEATTASTVESTEALLDGLFTFEASASAITESTEATIISDTPFEVTANASVDASEASLTTQGAVEFAVSTPATIESTEVLISNENLYEVVANTTAESTEAAVNNENAFEVAATSTVESTEAAIANENVFEATAASTVESTEASLTTTGQIDFSVSTNATAESTEAVIVNENAFEATAASTVESTEASLTTTGQIDFSVSTNATAESTEALLDGLFTFEATADTTVETTEASVINVISFGVSSTSTAEATEAAISNENLFFGTSDSTVFSSEAFLTVTGAALFSASTPATLESSEIDLLIESLYIIRNPDGSPGGVLQKVDGSPGGVIKVKSGATWIDQ